MPTGGSQLQVSITHDEGGVLISVGGELDLASSPALEEAIIPFRDQAQPLILDLTAVTFVDVVGIRAIIRVCEEGHARLGAGSPQVRRMLQLIEQVSSIATGGWWVGDEPS